MEIIFTSLHETEILKKGAAGTYARLCKISRMVWGRNGDCLFLAGGIKHRVGISRLLLIADIGYRHRALGMDWPA